MTRTESLKRIRNQLVKRRQSLFDALRGDLRLLQSSQQKKTGDVLDAAADTISDELNSQLIEAESRELEQIEAAIRRFDADQFGVCQGCGKNIPLTRLRAVPYATDCIGCRRRHEAPVAAPMQWNRIYTASEVEVA